MWVNHGEVDGAQAKQAFSSLDAVFALKGEAVTSSSLCSVDKVVFAEGDTSKAFYIKRYCRAGEGLSGIVGISKARREWQNLLRFADWGLPVAQLAAYGEEAWTMSSRRGVVVTREIKNSTDLARLANQKADQFRRPDWVRSVSQQVAHATRVMHQHNFAHNDWKWRNILVVETDDGPRIYMIDCPAGMTWWGPFFEYRRIKDLACLDKIGRYTLSRSQRLRFYLDYVQRDRLNHRDKKVIRKILAFFAGRE